MSIVSTAEGLIGKETGKFDCSAFTQYVYSLHGKNISRTSGEQFNKGQNLMEQLEILFVGQVTSEFVMEMVMLFIHIMLIIILEKIQ